MFVRRVRFRSTTISLSPHLLSQQDMSIRHPIRQPARQSVRHSYQPLAPSRGRTSCPPYLTVYTTFQQYTRKDGALRNTTVLYCTNPIKHERKRAKHVFTYFEHPLPLRMHTVVKGTRPNPFATQPLRCLRRAHPTGQRTFLRRLPGISHRAAPRRGDFT